MSSIKSLEVSFLESINQISYKDWTSTINSNEPFFDYEFFYALEKSKCTSSDNGWKPKHLLFKRNKKILGIIPNFEKNNSNGEYVFDHSWANAYFSLGVNYYPKFLSAIPFTPINGNRYFFSDINDSSISKNINLLLGFLEKQPISSFHLNFIDKKQSEILNKNGFLTRHGIQYHWYNKNYKTFEDFLYNLKGRKKKNIIKERSSLKELGIKYEIKMGSEISSEDINFFYKCYTETVQKKWAQKYLNFDFFKLLLKSNLKNTIVLFIAKDKDNNYLACALNFKGTNKLYGRYWGCVREVPFLHFELCYYQSIEYAIKNKIEIIESGAQGEHKIARGYEPTITYSNHWIKNTRINEAVINFLKQETLIVMENFKILKQYVPFKK